MTNPTSNSLSFYILLKTRLAARNTRTAIPETVSAATVDVCSDLYFRTFLPSAGSQVRKYLKSPKAFMGHFTVELVRLAAASLAPVGCG